MSEAMQVQARSPRSTQSVFRKVLASPDEAIVLAIADTPGERGLSQASQAVTLLREAGRKLRLVVYADSNGTPTGLAFPAPGFTLLESWAKSMLPAILAEADVVLALGDRSKGLLHELRDNCRECALVVRTDLLEGFGDVGRVRFSWDSADVEVLCQTLRERRPNLSEPEASVQGKRARAELAPPLSVPEAEKDGVTPHGLAPRTARGPVHSLVLYNNWGIGDELLLSAVARELVRSHPSLDVWIRSRFGFRFTSQVRRDAPPSDAESVETIYQNPTLYSPSAHSPFPGHLVQQMLDKVALDTGLKVKAKDLSPELELPSRPGTDRKKRSCIVHSRPNSRLSSKDWGLSRWERLARILIDNGWRVRQVGGNDEPRIPGSEDLRGIPVAELPAVFLESDAVVCVVGFLMHLAEATQTPAVVIYGGREHPAIDGYPDQTHFCSEPLACRGRWGCHLGPDLECPHGMKCMERLTPELVAGTALGLFDRNTTGGYR